ncbi:IS1634 family transposase ISMac12 [subsurface metagenome]
MTYLKKHCIIITMSFPVEQKVGNHIYVYEAEGYWDKTKKQSRQHRKYLGKKDPKTGKIISTNRGYKSWDYGNTYFLNIISKQIGLEKILKQIFPDNWRDILACAFFEISEKKSLYLCKPWLECTHQETNTKNLSSQRISELLEEIGKSEEARSQFFKAWAEKYKKNKFIIFDITSFSSYSKKLELIEPGYNRDKEKLPQVNFGVIYGEPFSLPLFYTKYPGSISDVKTLQNMVEYLEWLKLTNSLFVLDKGFFSSYNIKKMEKNMKFLIPLPYSNKNALELVKKHNVKLGSYSNSFQLNNNILYCIKDEIEIGGEKYNAYIYLDESRRVEKRNIFLKKMLEVESIVKNIDCKNKEELDTFLTEHIKGWKNIFQILERSGKIKLRKKEKGINSYLERLGTFILVSNKNIDRKEALYFYRRKDVIEKFFDNIKNDINRKRLRVHKQETFEGRLFVDFIALIIYSWIKRIMRNEGINKSHTVQELIYEFKKIKLIQIGEKKRIITEVSKKQRDLLEKFNIKPPG